MKPGRKEILEKLSRRTPQRRILLEELSSLTSHPTAEELYKIVKRRLPCISLATVYRNLDEMADQGLILRIRGAGSKKRYDATTMEHYHFRCTRCGALEDLKVRPIAALSETVRSVKGCAGFHLEFHGLCPSCGGRGEKKKR